MKYVEIYELEILSCLIVHPELLKETIGVIPSMIYHDGLYQAVIKVAKDNDVIIQMDVTEYFPIDYEEFNKFADWYKFPHTKNFTNRLAKYMELSLADKVEKMVMEKETADEIVKTIIYYNEKAAIVDSKDMYDYVEETIELLGDHGEVYPTGLTELDNTVQLTGGNLMIVSALPKTGKSTVALNMANNMIRAKKKIAYFSFEMSSSEVIQKLVSLRSRKKIKNRDTFVEYSKELLSSQVNDYFKLVNSNGYTIPQIKKYITDNDVKVAYIDQLDCLPTDKRERRHDLRIGNNVVELKNLAVELNIVIVLLHQLNRTSATLGMPEVHNLKDSQVVEQKADAVILLNKVEDSDDLWCKVGANRMGAEGTCRLEFIRDLSLIRDKNDYGSGVSYDPSERN